MALGQLFLDQSVNWVHSSVLCVKYV